MSKWQNKQHEIKEAIIKWLESQRQLQPLFHQWHDLNAQKKLAWILGSFGGIIFILWILAFNQYLHLHSIKKEMDAQKEILTIIQTSGQELNRLKTQNRMDLGSPSMSVDQALTQWRPYVEGIVNVAGLNSKTLQLTAAQGEKSSQMQEIILQLNLGPMNLKQLIKILEGFEKGSKPVVVKNIEVTTEMDLSGYLQAIVTLSTFSQVKNSS